MELHGNADNNTLNKAKVAPLLIACALASPISFFGYITLGFCGLVRQCLPDELLIFAVPCAVLAIWLNRLGAASLWVVFVLAFARFLLHNPRDTGEIVMVTMLLAAVLLVQFATPIANYFLGERGGTQHEPF